MVRLSLYLVSSTRRGENGEEEESMAFSPREQIQETILGESKLGSTSRQGWRSMIFLS